MSAYNKLQSKIVNLSQASNLVQAWKETGEKVVFTNGVFDLLHIGHIDYLAKASDLGSKLVIGLNADDSVKRLNKGPARPIKNQETRSVILAALAFVDLVVIFADDTPLHLINTIQPSVLVKGGDYNPNETDENSTKYMVGSKEVRANGGSVEVIQFVPGHSTSRLEEKIIQANLR